VCEATGGGSEHHRPRVGRAARRPLGGRVRRADGGRKAAIERQAGLLEAPAELVQMGHSGRSASGAAVGQHLAGALAERGFVASTRVSLVGSWWVGRITSWLQDAAVREIPLIAAFFATLRETAEQLTDLDRWYRILSHALVKYLKGCQLDPPRRLQAA
jgi:hypothetical protein